MNKLRAKFGAHPGKMTCDPPVGSESEETPPMLFPGTSFEMGKCPLQGILARFTCPIRRDRASQDIRHQLPKQTQQWQSIDALSQDRGPKLSASNLETLNPSDPPGILSTHFACVCACVCTYVCVCACFSWARIHHSTTLPKRP